MADYDDGRSEVIGRRRALACMAWAGTGVLWTISGGVAHSLSLLAQATTTPESVKRQDAGGLTFLQISDSHVGFAKPLNPNVKGTLEQAIDRIKSMPVKPSFLIHTGDITHLSRPSEFDDAEHIISQAQLDVHYVPGEHDVLDPEVKLYREHFGRGSKGAGWYSFDANGVHFMALVNVVTGVRFMDTVHVDNPGGKAGGLGELGNEQLAWIEDDLKGRSASTPLVVFAHMPLWSVYPSWGWGTEDSARALGYMKRFGSVTVLNGHIHQVVQKVEGNITFHTARSTAFPFPAPGSAPTPGPLKVPADKLRTMIGSATVTFKQGEQQLAIVDTPLQG